MHIKTAVPIVIVQKKAAAMCLLSELSMIFRKRRMKKGMSISAIDVAPSNFFHKIFGRLARND